MKVVNLRFEKFDVYIGRGSIWGNKFRIGVDGNRKEVIKKYFDLMMERLRGSKKDFWISELKKLEGKSLGCFCKPESCHGDVLVWLIKFLKRKGV